MMGRERQKDLVYQENMLEVVDHGLSVEIVHRDRQKVPKTGD
jgi:hypothetical protein